MTSYTVQLLPYQIELLESTAPEVCLIAGLATGKTRALTVSIINYAFTYPKGQGIISGPSYTTLYNSVIRDLVGFLQEHCIPYVSVLSGSQKRIEINGVKFFLYSLDNYDAIRGVEASVIFVDEACYAKKEAIDVLRGRLRHPHGKRQLVLVSSPNGYDHIFNDFGHLQTNARGKKLGKNIDTFRHLIQAETRLNIFLPEGYYNQLLNMYGGPDSSLAKQELFGKFVNMHSGSIYWGFKRDISTQDNLVLDPKFPVYVGMDFNIDQMNAVLMQYIGKKLYVVDRIHLDNLGANTYDMAKHLVDNYSQYHLKIIPDSTGKARKTTNQSSASDIEILRQHGLNVELTRNPFIRDRQNSVNIQFKNKTLIINSKLTTLIKEIETLASRDKEGSVSHAAVAMGYVVWHLCPMKKVVRKQEFRELNI